MMKNEDILSNVMIIKIKQIFNLFFKNFLEIFKKQEPN